VIGHGLFGFSIENKKAAEKTGKILRGLRSVYFRNLPADEPLLRDPPPPISQSWSFPYHRISHCSWILLLSSGTREGCQ